MLGFWGTISSFEGTRLKENLPIIFILDGV